MMTNKTRDRTPILLRIPPEIYVPLREQADQNNVSIQQEALQIIGERFGINEIPKRKPGRQSQTA
jgi:hypothetical protein